jgi:hypothetical protein
VQPPCHSSRIGMTQESIIEDRITDFKKIVVERNTSSVFSFFGCASCGTPDGQKTELFGEPKVMFQALTVWQIPANGR